MKYPTYILSSIFVLIILFCLQLCLLKYEHNTTINLLLIAYAYALFTPLSILITATLIVMLDMFNFLLTGYFGFISILLVLISWGALTIKDNFYNKLIMPVICIITYQLIESLLFYIALDCPPTLTAFLLSCIINNLCFVAIWYLTKQPLHN